MDSLRLAHFFFLFLSFLFFFFFFPRQHELSLIFCSAAKIKESRTISGIVGG